MNIPTNLPVPTSPTFDIHDASKTDTFMRCPRKYFYSYVLGWRSTWPNIHLIHGEGWHRAQEHLLLNGFDIENVAEAVIKYEEFYRESFPEFSDIERYPKNPLGCREALLGYIRKYKNDNWTVIATEIAGSVPVSEKHTMRFRLDSLVSDDKYIYSMDHKTGSKDSRTWRNQFILAVQMSLYSHVLFSLKGIAEEVSGKSIFGMIVNGSIFYKSDKSEHKHMRLKIRKEPIDMKIFLWQTVGYLNLIEMNFELLSNCKDSDDFLRAFPMNPTACDDYGGCPFHDYCVAVPNPLRYVDNTPQDYKIEHWNPAAYADERAKVKVDGGKVVKGEDSLKMLGEGK